VRRSTNQVQRCSITVHHQLTDAHTLLESEKQVAFLAAGEAAAPKIQPLHHWAAQLAANPVRKYAVLEN
jgi:hypothetical protein